jgi:hypothetical protein
LTAASFASTQAAAEKWRTGLAAFVTLVTGGLLIKGPASANDLTTGWRIVLTALAGGGLVAAIAGLWMALRAAAGAPGPVGYPEIVEEYGGVRQFEVACAKRSARALQRAKVTMLFSLSLLVLAVFAWWWAPTKSAPTPRQAVSARGALLCGTLLSGEQQRFNLLVDGDAGPRAIPLDSVESVRIVTSC